MPSIAGEEEGMSDVYVVVHISMTCDESSSQISKDSSEIIEIAWDLVDASNLEVTHQESVFVRPANTPITQYCTQKNGITWEHVRNAGTFKDAISLLDEFVQDKILKQNRDFTFVTVDIKNLSVQIPRESREKAVEVPDYLQNPRVFELITEFSKWNRDGEQRSLSSPMNYSLEQVIEELGVDITAEEQSSLRAREGPKVNANLEVAASSGVTHTRQLTSIFSRVLIQLIKKSSPSSEFPSVLTKPYDFGEDLRVFLNEKSKVLFLNNLPGDTTQYEIESWFTQYGGRPVAFWNLKSNDSTANLKSTPYNNYNTVKSNRQGSVSGFAVFYTHEEARESLSLNGRALNDRVIEVLPSSTLILDKAQDLLTPFPSSKNRPRPGDWTCPSCGFSNFQRRTACFRCSFPAASAVTIQESMFNGVNHSRRHMPGQMRTINAENISHKNNLGGNPLYRQSNGYSNYSDVNNGQGYSVNLNALFNSNTYLNGQTNMQGSNYSNSHGGNSRSHYGNSVPFRAGDWKCTKDSCQYHNFAKNICCLKCGSAKPSMPSQAANVMAMHSINSTAAAIAAATASGQSLNLSNSYMNMQHPSHHYSNDFNQPTGYQQDQLYQYSNVSNSAFTKAQLVAQLAQNHNSKPTLNLSSQVLSQQLAAKQYHSSENPGSNKFSHSNASSPSLYSNTSQSHDSPLGNSSIQLPLIPMAMRVPLVSDINDTANSPNASLNALSDLINSLDISSYRY